MSRFDYVKYDEKATQMQLEFKEKMIELEAVIEKHFPNPGRGKASALTNLEQCYMWLGKEIRDDQIHRNGSAELMESRGNE